MVWFGLICGTLSTDTPPAAQVIAKGRGLLECVNGEAMSFNIRSYGAPPSTGSPPEKLIGAPRRESYRVGPKVFKLAQ